MAKRLLSILIVTVASLSGLTACDKSADSPQNLAENISTNSTADNAIDWAAIATTETPIEKAQYDYPFAIDSQNVSDYADYFDIDNQTAQHNLTVSMASNELLSKMLNQLGASYTSHELTDGEDITLIIHTTPDVAAGRYDYVFEDDFAKGLVLPVEVVPDGVKGEGAAHGDIMDEEVIE